MLCKVFAKPNICLNSDLQQQQLVALQKEISALKTLVMKAMEKKESIGSPSEMGRKQNWIDTTGNRVRFRPPTPATRHGNYETSDSTPARTGKILNFKNYSYKKCADNVCKNHYKQNNQPKTRYQSFHLNANLTNHNTDNLVEYIRSHDENMISVITCSPHLEDNSGDAVQKHGVTIDDFPTW